MILAHDWGILKGERIRRWPSQTGDDPRPVEVEINTWRGVSFGAKHWNVSVEEAKNQWWSEDDNAWVQLSCDSENGGFEMRASVYTEEEAIALAAFFIKSIMKAKKKTTTINGNRTVKNLVFPEKVRVKK